jgi:hypothetical protein
MRCAANSLRKQIIHLLSADPKEGLPFDFVETRQPWLFSSEEFDAVSLLLSQKTHPAKGEVLRESPKIPAHFQIDRVLGSRSIAEIRFKLSVVKN